VFTIITCASHVKARSTLRIPSGYPPASRDVRTSTPAELGAFTAREIEKWAEFVREAKIDPE
jgi:hypothetical protein